MSRLTNYLVRLFWTEAAALFGVALFLLFLIQCLRIFDLVSVRGQNLLTLFGQAMLSMPPLMVVFFYVCLGIGVGRALRQLQATHELHIIHAGRRVSAIFAALGLTMGAGALAVLVLTHIVEPTARRGIAEWSAAIAADLVGRTLTPNRFAEVVPGVTIVIGGRQGNGEITDFFADDHREGVQRRTYIAASATISADPDGYVLQLRDGALQYMTEGGQYSEVAFERYDMAVEHLTGAIEDRDVLAETSSVLLVQQSLQSGVWPEETLDTLFRRTAEGFRVVALALLVAAIAAFPHGRRRRREMPLEITVLLAAFFERGLNTYLPLPRPFDAYSGSAVLLAIGLGLLAIKLRHWRPVPRRQAVAP